MANPVCSICHPHPCLTPNMHGASGQIPVTGVEPPPTEPETTKEQLDRIQGGLGFHYPSFGPGLAVNINRSDSCHRTLGFDTLKEYEDTKSSLKMANKVNELLRQENQDLRASRNGLENTLNGIKALRGSTKLPVPPGLKVPDAIAEVLSMSRWSVLADKTLIFMSGINLQDHPVKEQREARDLCHELLAFLASYRKTDKNKK